MVSKVRKRGTVVLLAALLALPAGAQTNAEAERLLAAGQARDAYRLLLQEEAARAGEPGFDYLLGRAALEAGEAAQATLVFERVLAVDPNHAGARLDMGRAYFLLGDHPRAKAEFDSLLALDPPPAARATIEGYLAAIAGQPAATRTKASGYLEAGFGHDSNVTIGPRQNTIVLPVFGLSFTLSDASRAQSDTFHQEAAGGEVLHSLESGDAVFAGADVRHRHYADIGAYDQLSGEVRGGYLWNRGAQAWRAYASYGEVSLGSERYREVTSAGGDWRRQLNPRDQVAAFAQWSAIRHVPDLMQSSDYDQYLLGAGWTRLPAETGGLLLTAAGFVGGEREVEERTDGDKRFVGVRGGALVALRSDLDVHAGATLQHGRYRRTNLVYDVRRRDSQYDLQLGATWRFAPGWSLKPQVSWTRNDSNTSINEYQRAEANLAVRRDF